MTSALGQGIRLFDVTDADRMLPLIRVIVKGMMDDHAERQALLDRLKEREFDVEVKAVEQAGRLGTLVNSRHHAIVVSNRVWDAHAALLEQHPERFWRLSSRLTPQSLEAVRDELGFVV